MKFLIEDLISRSDDFLSYIRDISKPVVYKFTKISDNRSYIGITSNISNRLYSNNLGHITTLMRCTGYSHLQNEIRKSNFTDFTYEIIHISDNYKEVEDLEPKFIKEFNSCYNGFNYSTSGKLFTKGDIFVNNGERSIIIRKYELEDAYKNGFIYKGRISNKRINITNGIRNVLIYEDEFCIYEPLGFWIGYKSGKDRILMNKDNSLVKISSDKIPEYIDRGYSDYRDELFLSKSNKGTITMTSPLGEYKYVPEYKIEEYLTKGYIKGRVGNNLKKGDIFINNGLINKRIPKSDLSYYVSLGFVKGKINNSERKIYYNNGVKEIQIRPDESDYYESLGYTRGLIPSIQRGMSGRKVMTSPNGDRVVVKESEVNDYLDKGFVLGGYNPGNKNGDIIVHKGTENKRIFLSEFPKYESEGWSRGKYQKYVRKYSYNNGSIQVNIIEDKIQEYINKGFIKGRLPKNNNIKGRVQMTSPEGRKKMAKKEDIDHLLSIGFKLGYKKSKSD